MQAIKFHELQWIRDDSWQRSYRLRAGMRDLLALRWSHERGLNASAEARRRRWNFLCIGYLSKQVIVQSPNHALPLAIFKQGALRFTDGRVYRLKHTSPLCIAAEWQDGQGRPLLRLNVESGAVEMCQKPASGALYDTALLIALGWYLLMSMHLDMQMV
ncbi:MAG: hypothetical protein HXY40_14175 [Chloroflexi bacterium]|nr:hypothetical protein [Chloroflexota bacterium]